MKMKSYFVSGAFMAIGILASVQAQEAPPGSPRVQGELFFESACQPAVVMIPEKELLDSEIKKSLNPESEYKRLWSMYHGVVKDVVGLTTLPAVEQQKKRERVGQECLAGWQSTVKVVLAAKDGSVILTDKQNKNYSSLSIKFFNMHSSLIGSDIVVRRSESPK
jgi:hypothetical protein